MASLTFVALIALVILCLNTMGLVMGSVVWLAIFGIVVGVSRLILRRIGDPSDVATYERRSVP